MIHNWGKLHEDVDYIYKITQDGRYLFSKNLNGDLKQWCIFTRFCRDWGKVLGGRIYHFNISEDSKYLFTAGAGRNLKQWSVESGGLVRDWGEIMTKSPVNVDTSG